MPYVFLSGGSYVLCDSLSTINMKFPELDLDKITGFRRSFLYDGAFEADPEIPYESTSYLQRLELITAEGPREQYATVYRTREAEVIELTF